MKRNKGKEKAASRKDLFAVTGILANLCVLLMRIPLTHMIGENGVGYFSIANELFLVISCFCAYGLSEAVTVLVRYRIKREQYKSARKVVHGGLIMAFIIGGSLSILLSLFSQNVAEYGLKIPLAGLAISLMAPAIIFQLLTAVLKGFFQGSGSRIPSIHSKILEVILYVSGGLIGAALFYKHGIKVSALLQEEAYAGVYGAMGASVGILAASVLCFLHMLILYFMYRRVTASREIKEIQKNQDKGNHVLHMIIGTAIPYSLFAGIYQILPILDIGFFTRWAADGIDIATVLGKYYGKYMVIIGVLTGFFAFMGVDPVKRITHLIEREEYRLAREKMEKILHQYVVFIIPTVIFTAVFGENLLNSLFKGDHGTEAAWIMSGSILIVLGTLTTFFSNLLVRLRKMKYVILYEIAGLILHIVTVLVLLKGTDLGIMAIIIGNIVFLVVTVLAGYTLTAGIVQYKQEWVHSIAIPAVVAGISGLIGMLLNKVFLPHIGSFLSLLICLLTSVIVYIILLLVSRGLRQEELQDMPGGEALIWISKRLHLM